MTQSSIKVNNLLVAIIINAIMLNFLLSNAEEYLEVVFVESTNNYLIYEEEDFLELKDKVIDGLE
jgi:hypothetical protein